MKAFRKLALVVAAGALLTTSAQAQVDFNEFEISEALTVAAIELAIGAPSTTAIDAIALTSDPDEVIIAHLDGSNNYTFASISLSAGTANWAKTEASIVADLNASITGDNPFSQLILEGEFVARDGVLYFADSSVDLLGTPPFRFSVNALDLTTQTASNVILSADVEGWHTHGILSDGTVVGTLGEAFSAGEPNIGYVDSSDNYVQVFEADDLVAEANSHFSVTSFVELPPEAVAVDPGNDNVYVFAHDNKQLFRVIDITGATPTLEVVDIPAWNYDATPPVDFHGMAIDEQGNLYAFDEEAPVMIRVWDRTDTFDWTLGAIAEAINGVSAPQFGVSTWRGIKAREVNTTQSAVFLASGSNDYGVVRIVFGAEPTSVNNWHLFE